MSALIKLGREIGKARTMRVAVAATRVGAVIGIASLVAGCVEPAYQMPGPIPLQPYPPSVSYETGPDYRPPVSGPIPLQAAPPIQPLPPAAPAVTETEPSDSSGAIPLQDMPAPAPAVVEMTPPADTVTAPAAAPAVTKAPTTTAGKNVPLEGFRPMHGQTRPAP